MTVPDWAPANAPNFRDLGGLPGEGGAPVRSGVLYRSEALSNLSDADMRMLGKLGISLVCDLRSPSERQQDGHPLASALMIAPQIMSENAATGEGVARSILADATGITARDYMFDAYRTMPGAFADGGGFRELLSSMLEPGGLPMLICCHAGKDRTGFVTGVVLRALGVPRDVVIDDYMRSDPLYNVPRIQSLLISRSGGPLDFTPQSGAVVPMGVQPDYLEAAFEEIDARWGSFSRYLEEAGGLTDARREELLARFLEPSPAGESERRESSVHTPKESP